MNLSFLEKRFIPIKISDKELLKDLGLELVSWEFVTINYLKVMWIIVLNEN